MYNQLSTIGLVLEMLCATSFLFIFSKAHALYNSFEEHYKLSSLYYFYHYIFSVVMVAFLGVHIISTLFENPIFLYINEISRACAKMTFVFYAYSLWRRPYSLKYFPMVIFTVLTIGVSYLVPLLISTIDFKHFDMIFIVPAVSSVSLFLYILFNYITHKTNGITIRVLISLFLLFAGTMFFIFGNANGINTSIENLGSLFLLLASLVFLIPIIKERPHGC